MKKLLSYFMSTLLAFCTISFAPAAHAEIDTMLVLGDSIAANAGVSIEEGYGYLLAEEFNYTYVNKAVSGYKTTDLVSQLETTEVSQEVQNADVIVISIGGNDFLQYKDDIIRYMYIGNEAGIAQLAQQAIMSIRTNLTIIVDKIKSLNSEATLVLQTIYVTPLRLFGASEDLISEVKTFNSVFHEYVKIHKGAYLVADVCGAFEDNKTKTLMQSDCIHPNAAGHVLIAETISETLQSVTSDGVMLGDANVDGKVNAKDVLIVRKHIALVAVDIDEKAANVNADETVNTKDVLLLRKYIAGCDVKFGRQSS